MLSGGYREVKSGRQIALALVAGLAVSAGAQGKGDNGKLSGVLFGDLYSVGSHNSGKSDGKSGLWNRRFNLSYDRKLDAAWSMRLRVEFGDAGKASHGQNVFSSEHSVDPFMKDAWLRYTMNGQKITFGLIPTPSYEPNEERLGYRPFEKTPLDFWRLGSSRDKGISIAGPLDADKKFDYMLMVGDGSGRGSSKSGLHTVYGRLGYKATPELYINLYGDAWKRDKGSRWQTAMLEGFYTNEAFKLGLSYVTQRRTAPGVNATNVNVLSLYGEAKLNETISPFVRFDVVSQALSDADKIAYYNMSKNGKPTVLQAGIRYRLNKNLEVAPSITSVSYRRVGAAAVPKNDTIFRLTFSLKF